MLSRKKMAVSLTAFSLTFGRVINYGKHLLLKQTKLYIVLAQSLQLDV